MATGMGDDVQGAMQSGMRTTLKAAHATKTVAKATAMAATGNLAGAAAQFVKSGSGKKVFGAFTVFNALVILFCCFAAPLFLYEVIDSFIKYGAHVQEQYYEDKALASGGQGVRTFKALGLATMRTAGELAGITAQEADKLGDFISPYAEGIANWLPGDDIEYKLDSSTGDYYYELNDNIYYVLSDGSTMDAQNYALYQQNKQITSDIEAAGESNAVRDFFLALSEYVSDQFSYLDKPGEDENTVSVNKKAVAKAYAKKIKATQATINNQIDNVYNAISAQKKDIQKYLEEHCTERFERDFAEQLEKQKNGTKNEREDFDLTSYRNPNIPQDPKEVKESVGKKLYSDWHDINKNESFVQELRDNSSDNNTETMYRDYTHYIKDAEDMFFEEDGKMVQYNLSYISYYISKTKVEIQEAFRLLTLNAVMTSDTVPDIQPSGYMKWIGVENGPTAVFDIGDSGMSASVNRLSGGFMPQYLVLEERENKYDKLVEELNGTEKKGFSKIISIMDAIADRTRYNRYKISPIDLIIYVDAPSIDGIPETKNVQTDHKFFEWVPEWYQPLFDADGNMYDPDDPNLPRDVKLYSPGEYVYGTENEVQENIYGSQTVIENAKSNMVTIPEHYRLFSGDGFGEERVDEKYVEQYGRNNWEDDYDELHPEGEYHGPSGKSEEEYDFGGWVRDPVYETVYNPYTGLYVSVWTGEYDEHWEEDWQTIVTYEDPGGYDGYKLPYDIWNWRWVPNNYVSEKQSVVYEISYGMHIDVSAISTDALVEPAGFFPGELRDYSAMNTENAAAESSQS